MIKKLITFITLSVSLKAGNDGITTIALAATRNAAIKDHQTIKLRFQNLGCYHVDSYLPFDEEHFNNVKPMYSAPSLDSKTKKSVGAINFKKYQAFCALHAEQIKEKMELEKQDGSRNLDVVDTEQDFSLLQQSFNAASEDEQEEARLAQNLKHLKPTDTQKHKEFKLPKKFYKRGMIFFGLTTIGFASLSSYLFWKSNH